MIRDVIKRVEDFLQDRCEKIPTSKRKDVVIAMFATFVVIVVVNFITY